MDRRGRDVTRCRSRAFRARRMSSTSFWPSSAELGSYFSATDLAEVAPWGWHRSNGLCNTVDFGSSADPWHPAASAKGGTITLEEARLLQPGEERRELPYGRQGLLLDKVSDQGPMSCAISDEGGEESRAVINWTRTGRTSVAQLDAIEKRFVGVETNGTAPSFAFAIDLGNGEGLWVSQASDEIASVTGPCAATDAPLAPSSLCSELFCFELVSPTLFEYFERPL